MDSLTDDLTAALAGDEPDYDTDPAPPEDADHANRMLRRLARVRREMADLDALVAAERERLDAWHDARRAILLNRERWIADGLEMWHRAILAMDPKRKSINLPCGTLKLRARQDEYVFTDEAAFIAWAEGHQPDLLRTKVEVDRKAVRGALAITDTGAAVTEDGEVVPGVEVTIRPAGFTAATEEVGDDA